MIKLTSHKKHLNQHEYPMTLFNVWIRVDGYIDYMCFNQVWSFLVLRIHLVHAYLRYLIFTNLSLDKIRNLRYNQEYD
jgi:hypothetical protein